MGGDMMLGPIFSTRTDEWATPPEVFAKLDRRYRFTLDPCATPENAKCAIYLHQGSGASSDTLAECPLLG